MERSAYAHHTTFRQGIPKTGELMSDGLTTILAAETVEEDPPVELRLHPGPDWPRFIPRFGHRQDRLARPLSDQGVTMTVSPLYYMEHNPGLALSFRSGSRRWSGTCSRQASNPGPVNLRAMGSTSLGRQASPAAGQSARGSVGRPADQSG